MALSGLDIYKLLPKTNCRECGFVTCLAFAMQLAKKAVSIDKCPHLTAAAKGQLEASSLPPIKLVTLGVGDEKFAMGNETVLFRHEEKFHNSCGLGFILDDTLAEVEVKQRLAKINKLKFERVGQQISVNLVAVRQSASKDKFVSLLKLVLENTKLAVMIISKDLESLKAALEISKERNPLVYHKGQEGVVEVAKFVKDYKAALVAYAPDLEALSSLAKQLNDNGVSDLILDTGAKAIKDKIWDFTQIRRLSLKKGNRSLGYPILAMVDNDDPYEEIMEASTYISKYASLVLIKTVEEAHNLALLTLRQNIYTDPQKPLQIEPKLYSIGQTNDKSPLIVTTNFSLTYYTVLGEVEGSKVPSYILGVDTEGMSVLTAWAAEKFNADKIIEAMNKFEVKDRVTHKQVVIPGYVAVMSGDLEDKLGWKVIVGPKEAAGLPSFLKNLA